MSLCSGAGIFSSRRDFAGAYFSVDCRGQRPESERGRPGFASASGSRAGHGFERFPEPEHRDSRLRFGRGLRALDALAMLEESRLAAERWRGAAPDEIEATAAALQSLRDMKARWQQGAMRA